MLGYHETLTCLSLMGLSSWSVMGHSSPPRVLFATLEFIWLAWAGLSGPGYKPGPPCRWFVREHMPPCSRACARSCVDPAGFLFPAIRGKGRVEALFRESFLFPGYGNPASHTGGGTVFRGGSSLLVFSKTTPRLGVISPLRGVELSLGGRFTYPLSPRWGDRRWAVLPLRGRRRPDLFGVVFLFSPAPSRGGLGTYGFPGLYGPRCSALWGWPMGSHSRGSGSYLLSQEGAASFNPFPYGVQGWEGAAGVI